MNTLTANIQREWLSRIISGFKRIEYRDLTDFWLKKLAKVGAPPLHLRLINGMRADSPEALALVNRVDVDVFQGLIRFHIAKVLSTTRWNSKWQEEFPPEPEDEEMDPEVFAWGVKLKPAAQKIDVPTRVLRSLNGRGPHTFSAATSFEQMLELGSHQTNSLPIVVSDGTTSRGAIAYKIFYEPFSETAEYFVYTRK
jgi:hypothetical protein